MVDDDDDGAFPFVAMVLMATVLGQSQRQLLCRLSIHLCKLNKK
jgi:hypothetical protein